VPRAALILLLCAITIAWPAHGPAFAADPIGHVTRVKGRVSVVRGGESAPLAEGAPIYPTDVLKTGLVGRVEVRFADDTSITLTDRSTFAIDDYGFPGPGARVRFRLAFGAVRAVSGKVAAEDPEAFSLATPVATIGIRGTDFWAGTLEGRFNVVLLSGPVVVVQNGRGQVELTEPGQATVIEVPGVRQPDPDAPDEEVANVLGEMARQAMAPGAPQALGPDRLSAVLNTMAF